MLIEQTYRIYHRLQRGSLDLCEKIIIARDYEADLENNPTAVTVKFIPKQKRELTAKEISEIENLCDTYNLKYKMNSKGEMEWSQEKMINNGKKRRGKM